MKWTTTTYDGIGRIVRIDNPDSTFSTKTYSDWTVTETDENGHQKAFAMDAYGRLAQVQEKNGIDAYTTSYKYDINDNITKITDTATSPNITNIYYDSLGRKTHEEDPDRGDIDYDYDSIGNLTERRDANGNTINFVYDELDRITEKNYASTGTVDVVYLYDKAISSNGIGNRTSMVDASGETRWHYDRMNRVIKKSCNIDGISYDLQWTYDALSRPELITYPNGKTLNISYNNAGETDLLDGFIQNVNYNAAKQEIFRAYNNSTETTLAYYPGNLRIQSITTPDFQEFTYTHDNVGNIKTISNALRSSTKNFAYDDVDRLISGDGKTFEYNSIGNMVSVDGVARTFSSSHPHALANDNVNDYIYDFYGNMISGAGRTINYDAENRPQLIVKDSTTTEFVYDGDGNRIKKIVNNGAHLTTTIYIDNLYEKDIIE